MSKKIKIALSSVAAVVGASSLAAALIVHGQKVNNNVSIGDDTIEAPTWDIIDMFQNNIINKSVKKIIYLGTNAGWSQDKIKKTVTSEIGLLLNNFKDASDHNNLDTKYLNNAYSLRKEEAKKANINIVDYQAQVWASNPSLNQFANDLISSGISKQVATKAAIDMRDTIQGIANKANTKLWDEFTYLKKINFTLSQNQTSLFKDVRNLGGITKEADDDLLEQLDMKSAGQYISHNLMNFLNPLEDPKGFIPLLKDYSASGKYDIGDEIETKDLALAFSFGYDKSLGVIWEDYDPADYGIDVSTLQPIDDPMKTSYDENLSYEFKPFSSYDGVDSTYGEGEIYPGYELHVKIIDKDVTTDSHTCVLQFKYGISKTGRDDLGIIWLDKDGNEKTDETNDDTGLKFNVTDFNCIKYITQHTYFNNEQLSVNLTDNDKQHKGDESGDNYELAFFGDYDGTFRNTDLLNLCAHIPVDENDNYLVTEDNPVFLDPKYLGGVTLPTGWSLDDNANDKLAGDTYHTNQNLKFAITDIDTDFQGRTYPLSIKGHWVIFDSISDTTPVIEYNWVYKTKTLDDIWIRYYLDPGTVDNLKKATYFSGLFTSLQYMSDCVQSLKDEKADKVADDIYIARSTFIAGLALIDALTVAAIVVDTGTVIATAGMNANAAWGIAIGIIIVGLLVVSTTFSGIALNKVIQWKDGLKDLINGFDDTDFKADIDKYANQITPYNSFMVNPKGNISTKIVYATNILNVASQFIDNGDKYYDWLVKATNFYRQETKQEPLDTDGQNFIHEILTKAPATFKDCEINALIWGPLFIVEGFMAYYMLLYSGAYINPNRPDSSDGVPGVPEQRAAVFRGPDTVANAEYFNQNTYTTDSSVVPDSLDIAQLMTRAPGAAAASGERLAAGAARGAAVAMTTDTTLPNPNYDNKMVGIGPKALFIFTTFTFILGLSMAVLEPIMEHFFAWYRKSVTPNGITYQTDGDLDYDNINNIFTVTVYPRGPEASKYSLNAKVLTCEIDPGYDEALELVSVTYGTDEFEDANVSTATYKFKLKPSADKYQIFNLKLIYDDGEHKYERTLPILIKYSS